MRLLSDELTPRTLREIQAARVRSTYTPTRTCAGQHCDGARIQVKSIRHEGALCTVCFNAATLELLAMMALENE